MGADRVVETPIAVPKANRIALASCGFLTPIVLIPFVNLRQVVVGGLGRRIGLDESLVGSGSA
jgi:hypothetical protein